MNLSELKEIYSNHAYHQDECEDPESLYDAVVVLREALLWCIQSLEGPDFSLTNRLEGKILEAAKRKHH